MALAGSRTPPCELAVRMRGMARQKGGRRRWMHRQTACWTQKNRASGGRPAGVAPRRSPWMPAWGAMDCGVENAGALAGTERGGKL